jgi:hypothetical protein
MFMRSCGSLKILPGGNAVMEFRRKWAPLIIVATYSVALLVPALMPSVQAKDALPPIGAVDFADMGDISAGDMSASMGPSDAVMAALHEQASAALRDLQMASAYPQ